MNEHTDQPDYQHGYKSGVQNTDPAIYEGYLSSQVHYDWLSQRIDEKRTEIQRINAETVLTTDRFKKAFDSLQSFVQEVEKADSRVIDLTAQCQTIDDENDRLRKRRLQTQSEYSLLAGLLFFVAGLSFVLGDLIISHEIVAYALNIRNNYEAWAFAVGLAMISILLKPVYDRLIEKPYTDEHSATSRTRYAWFKGALGIFAIITLGILGWFRYEAYRTDKLKEAINKAVKNIQLNATPLDPTMAIAPEQQRDILQKIEQQLQKSEELNLGLVNSPWALASFVLSGILFAIAGAVSLGMALPVLQNFWYRWLQIDPKLWKLKRRRNKTVLALQVAEKELSIYTVQKNISEKDLELLPLLSELKAEKQRLNEEIDQLSDPTRLAQADSRIATFNDGYSKGEAAREAMSDEEFQQIRNSHFTTNNLALKAASPSERSTQSNRPNELPPHKLIRKIITNQFREEQ
jgi:hypothetical protein